METVQACLVGEKTILETKIPTEMLAGLMGNRTHPDGGLKPGICLKFTLLNPQKKEVEFIAHDVWFDRCVVPIPFYLS